MQRKKFIKQCSLACIGALGVGILAEACGPSKMVNATIAGSDLQFPISDFEYIKDNEKKFKKYLIIQNDRLQFPICIFRFNEKEYSAVLMKCPHQGAELQVFGQKLQCPAHGSEFDTKGVVQSSPADSNLRSFPISIDNNLIKISLK